MTIYRSYFLLFMIYFLSPFDSGEEKATHLMSENVDSHRTDVAVNDYCRVNNHTFQDGETLTYKIYYNINFIWIGAGTVTFQINQRENRYYAEAIGKTYGGYDWIFKVRDTFQSVLDANTLLPIQSTRIVNEGSYTKYDHVKYMRNSRLAESVMGKTRQIAESKILTINQCVHDILSSMYALRNTPTEALERQNKFQLEMMMDREKYPITLNYSGKQNNKKIKSLGDVDTYLFEPRLIAGNVFKDESGMKIWVSQDENKVPLMIESPISVGKIKAILQDHKKLRYETLGY